MCNAEKYHRLEYMVKSLCKTSAEDIQQAVSDFLKKEGLSPNALFVEGQSIVLKAMEYADNAPLVRSLLECGANVYWKDHNGNGLLHYAMHNAWNACSAANGFDPNVIEVLLNKGLTFDERNNAGQTPMFALFWPLSYPPSSVGLGMVVEYNLVPNGRRLLQWIAERNNNMFATDFSGHSFLHSTHYEQYAEQFPPYKNLDPVFQPYRDLEQAHKIRSSLEISASNATKRKI